MRRLRIRVRKAAAGAGALTYVREDGSTTGQAATPYFVWHDLMHWAVESVLGYRTAFLGLLADGKAISDFERGAAAWIPIEAHWAEIITGQLQGAQTGSMRRDEVLAGIGAACEGLGVPVPTVDEILGDPAKERVARNLLKG